LYNYYSWGSLDGYTLQNYYHYFTAAPALANGAVINNELCYTANNSTGVLSQRGFYSTINGESSWQLHMAGTARSFINGNLGIGNSNPTVKLSVENGSVVFNSSAGNHDFTVGGDTDVHTLCVDASADSVGIGIATPLSTLHIEKNTIPSIRIQRSAPVGTASVPTERGHILFPNYTNVYDHVKLISWGRESSFLAGMLGVNISNSAGVSSEVLTIDNQSTASTFGFRTYNIPFVTTSGNAIFNETAGNYDFRVEGVSDQNLLFVDASNNSVNIGTGSSTGSKLYVATNNATNYSSILASGGAGSQSSLIRVSNTNNSINDSLAGLFISVRQPSTSTDQSAFISCLSSTQHVHTPHIVFGSRSGSSTFQELMRISSSGNVGIGTNAPTEKLDIDSNAIRIRTAQTPASATATGNVGDICWDSDYIYVCVATNTWKRSSLASW
jgi:hypothetical protein